jgi:OOP family OmpA-OmpF porin
MILDDLFAKSQAAGAKIDGVWIDGHADRIGGEAYNHKLAMRRALAVSDYLAAKGVAAAKMDLHEEGQSKPLVACDNVKARAALITCLAPNRRAEIKVDVSRTVNK